MNSKSKTQWIKHLDFIIIDIIALMLAFLAAYYVRHGWENPFYGSSYHHMMIALVFVDFIVLLISDPFEHVVKWGYYKEFIAALKHILIIEVLLIFYLFIIKESSSFSRQSLVLFPVFYLFLNFGFRILWKSTIRKRLEDRNQNKMLVMASRDRAAQIITEMTADERFHSVVTGIILLEDKKRDPEIQPIENVPIVAEYSDALEYLSRNWVDEVFVSANYEDINDDDLIEKIRSMGIVVYVEIPLFNHVQNHMVEIRDGHLIFSTGERTVEFIERVIKRLMDIVGGLIGSLITVLLMIIFGPIIYYHSPGSIFFIQERIGKNGKPFKMVKFRSMVPDAEARKAELMDQNKIEDGLMFKLDYDPRIIGCEMLPDGTIKKGIGNFIREHSIDEFPQFFNVLRGDMSLVGTRPPLPKEVAQYQYYHKTRLAMKPGITGLWQVSGRSTITDFDEVCKLDRRYIQEWNLGLDLKILCKTIPVVLKKDGAM